MTWKGLRAVLFAVALLLSMVPAAHAVGCRLQIIRVDYPFLVDPGESFPVKTQFNVTCSQSKAYIVGRFDVVESAPGVVLSSTSIPVGYFAGLNMSNQGGAGTNVNALTASCSEGVGVFQFQGYVRKTNSTFQRLGV